MQTAGNSGRGDISIMILLPSELFSMFVYIRSHM